MTGASVDKAQGLLSLIVMEMGGSSDLCALLKAGDPVILMGPTGSPTEIPEGETVCLAGGGLGNAVLFSIGQAMPGARQPGGLFRRLQEADRPLQGGADRSRRRCRGLVLRRSAGFRPGRPQDRSFTGNIVEAMRAYAAGDLGPVAIPLGDVDRIVAIGSDRMMQAVAAGAAWGVGAVPEAGACRDRVDQQPDAVHDEGNLRPVPSDAPRSGDGGGVGGVLLLQPGSGAGPGRFHRAERAASAEQRAGKADGAVDRPLPEGAPVAAAFPVGGVRMSG